MGGVTLSATPSVLSVALRAWITRAAEQKKGPHLPPHLPWPESALILDVETTTDASQPLLFGSYRVGNFGMHGEFECLEEGLIHADDLPEYDPAGWAVLQEYASTEPPATANLRRPSLALYSRREFLEKRLWKAIEAGALIVGYNLAFDLTRLAIGCADARGPMFHGGFSVPLWEWCNNGEWQENQHRPRHLFVVAYHPSTQPTRPGMASAALI